MSMVTGIIQATELSRPHGASLPVAIDNRGTAVKQDMSRVKEKHMASNRAWVLAHPDRVAAISLKYRSTHRAKIASYSRRWHVANRESIIAHARAYRLTHRAQSAKYCRVHRKEIAATKRTWRLMHPDECRAKKHRRRARLIGNGGTYSVAEWQAACVYWGNKCLRCGATERLTCDHVIPLFLGGCNEISNLQLLCLSCNDHKGKKNTDYRPVLDAKREESYD